MTNILALGLLTGSIAQGSPQGTPDRDMVFLSMSGGIAIDAYAFGGSLDVVHRRMVYGLRVTALDEFKLNIAPNAPSDRESTSRSSPDGRLGLRAG